jgi:signal transduction histidine kinase
VERISSASPQLGAGAVRSGARAPGIAWGPALTAIAGVLAAAFTFALVSGSDILVQRQLSAWVRAAFVLANVAGGAYTWWRRPGSGFGPLFALTGLLFALTSLNALAAPVAFTVGRVAYAIVMLALVCVCLSFPGSRLGSRLDRRFVGLLAAVDALVWLALLLLAEELPPSGPFADCAAACPENPLRVIDGAADAGRLLGDLANVVTVASFVAVTALLLGRMRESDRASRRTLAPLFLALSAVLVSLAAYTLVRQLSDARPPLLSAAVGATVLLLPAAILAGQVRGRLFAARRLGSLVADVAGTPVTGLDVQHLVGDALGDPTLTLARWDADANTYRDIEGSPIAALEAGRDRMSLELTRDGHPYALVRYHAAVDQPPDVVRGVAAGGLMLLDNARLAEERGRLVEELRASRARIATATHEGQVRIERDLHDGVQPHLSALLVKLGIARDMAEAEPELRALIDELGDDAAAAVTELRTLARGVYPPLLRERGLAAALQAFAMTAAVTVRVEERGRQATTPAATAAVYFTALEAIQNAIKHGGPAVTVEVTLDRGPRALAFAITDDGPGFDRGAIEVGVGLLSMEDRIGAAGGELAIRSAPGRGTTVEGWVPAD